MKPEIKQQWIAALRSGEYKQGKAMLLRRKATDEYCCLGVLCALAEQAGAVKSVDDPDSICISWGANGSTSYLPKEVQDWSSILDESGEYGSRDSLARDNDNGKSFNEIADIIEEHF